VRNGTGLAAALLAASAGVDAAKPNGHARTVPRVVPAPVPTDMSVGVAPTVQGDDLVVLTFVTPTGQAWYFVTPPAAEALARQLLASATQARSGIVLPPGSTGPLPGADPEEG
jgi:hypothetical protein